MGLTFISERDSNGEDGISAKAFASSFTAVSTRALSGLVSVTYFLVELNTGAKVAFLSAGSRETEHRVSLHADRNALDDTLAMVVMELMQSW